MDVSSPCTHAEFRGHRGPGRLAHPGPDRRDAREQAGLPDPQRLRRLPAITAAITAAHIGKPGKLRRHVRAMEQVLEQVERHLRAGAHPGEHGRSTESVPAVPAELFDVAAELAGTVAERGSPATALANRAVLLATGVIGRGLGGSRPP